MEIKKKLIEEIIEALYNYSIIHDKPFDYADIFFSLAFKTNDELRRIARAAGLRTKEA